MTTQTISTSTAYQLIRANESIIHIRVWQAPYFLCAMKYDPPSQEIMREIPSWTWIKDESAFKVHYLDMPILEAKALNIGYAVKYGDNVLDAFRALKIDYTDRKDWKTRQMVNIPAYRPLRNYQSIGAQFMYKAKKVLNADGMGSGKTAQAIGAVLLNKMDGRPYKTLVICPSSVKTSWKNEVTEVTGELFPEILHSNMTKRYDQYQAGVGKKDILIASYDTFIRDYAEMPEFFKPDILIIDEAHRLSNRQNKITQILIGGKTIKKTFGQMVDLQSIYLLTGTPISNKLEDLYAILKLIDPGIFSWTGFCNRYTIQEEVQRWVFSGGVRRAMKYFNVTGYRNEKELKGKLGLHMIRRTKEEVLPELPEKIYKTLEIELDTEERKIYNDLRKDFKAEIRGKEISIATKLEFMTRAQQICNSLETLPGSPGKKSSKLEEFLKVVNEQTKNHKIIVFSKYKTMTGIICRELKHLRPMHLNGDVPSEDRAEMIKKFQEDPKCRVFVSTIGAGGVGITLTAADVVILYDMAFTPAANSQAVDRAHRMGQRSSVNIVVMKVKDSIEERIYEINMSKQGIIDGMITDEKSVLARMPQEKLENLI